MNAWLRRLGFRLLCCIGLSVSAGAFTARADETPRSAENSVFRCTVNSWRIAERYGALAAPEGRQFVVLATRWESRIDPRLAGERGLSTAYTIPELAKHLFLVVDARHVGVLRPGLDDGTGRTSLAQLTLARPGAKQLGDVVFDIPRGAIMSADLRFYDDTAGYWKLALAGTAPEVKPLAPPQRNAVAEVGLFAFEDPVSSLEAPRGFRAIAVDLRARSVWTSHGEAPGFDATQPVGTLVERVNLLDWTDLPRQLHVIADSVYAYPPADVSGLPVIARFLPEFFVGGRVVFLVPADAKSLELECAMPHAATNEGVLDLPALRFPLGKSPDSAVSFPAPGPLRIEDEMLLVAIGARRVASFDDETAEAGRQFVVLTVDVTNRSETGMSFSPTEQLFLVTEEGGAELAADEITARGIHHPETQVHVGPGERRRFESVFQIDAKAKSPRLSFHGANFQQTYALPLP